MHEIPDAEGDGDGDRDGGDRDGGMVVVEFDFSLIHCV